MPPSLCGPFGNSVAINSRPRIIAKQTSDWVEPVWEPFGVEARHLFEVSTNLKACFVKLSCNLGGEAVAVPNCIHGVINQSLICEEKGTNVSEVVNGLFP